MPDKICAAGNRDQRENQGRMRFDIVADELPLVPEQVARADEKCTPNIGSEKGGKKEFLEGNSCQPCGDADQHADARQNPSRENQPCALFLHLILRPGEERQIDAKELREALDHRTSAASRQPIDDGCPDRAAKPRVDSAHENETGGDAVTFDQHPARKGKDEFVGCDACGVFQHHQTKHTDPAELVKDGLKGR